MATLTVQEAVFTGSEFWGATVPDLIDAWEGHCVATGKKK